MYSVTTVLVLFICRSAVEWPIGFMTSRGGFTRRSYSPQSSLSLRSVQHVSVLLSPQDVSSGFGRRRREESHSRTSEQGSVGLSGCVSVSCEWVKDSFKMCFRTSWSVCSSRTSHRKLWWVETHTTHETMSGRISTNSYLKDEVLVLIHCRNGDDRVRSRLSASRPTRSFCRSKRTRSTWCWAAWGEYEMMSVCRDLEHTHTHINTHVLHHDIIILCSFTGGWGGVQPLMLKVKFNICIYFFLCFLPPEVDRTSLSCLTSVFTTSWSSEYCILYILCTICTICTYIFVFGKNHKMSPMLQEEDSDFRTWAQILRERTAVSSWIVWDSSQV